MSRALTVLMFAVCLAGSAVGAGALNGRPQQVQECGLWLSKARTWRDTLWVGTMPPPTDCRRVVRGFIVARGYRPPEALP